MPEETYPSVVVVGSLTMDFTARSPRMPEKGETVLGDTFTMVPGGKGNNQALTSARQGVSTSIVGCIGDDSIADLILEAVASEGCDTSYLSSVPGPSGIAHIEVDHNGDNRIIMVPLANNSLTPKVVDYSEDLIKHCKVLLCQLEVPLESVQRALEIASRHGIYTILNPAPARELDDSILKLVDLLIPNETEAALLTGIDTSTREGALESARELSARSMGDVCVTRGSSGSIIVQIGEKQEEETDIFSVNAIDATAAGDAFCGGLAASLASGLSRKEAYRYASACGALATTKHGALPSLPFRKDVLDLIG